MLEIGLSLVAGALLGFTGQYHYQGPLIAPYTLLSPAPISSYPAQMCMYLLIAAGVVCSASGVSVFGSELVIYWRESASDHNKLAYFLGVNTAQVS